MKKAFSFFLVLVLVFCSASAALADTFTAGSTEVSLTVDRAADSYIVSIPAAVEIDPATKKGESQIVLKSGFQLISCNSLKVRISGFANAPIADSHDYINSKVSDFCMKSEEGEICKYRLLFDNHSADTVFENKRYLYTGSYHKNSPYSGEFFNVYEQDLISVDRYTRNENDVIAYLGLYVPVLPGPGTYTDTITFDIIIE